MKASKLVHKILKFINYANLCKFTEPRKGPGGAIGFFFFYFFFLYYYYFFFFFFHVPSGASYLYFSHSNFLIFSPFPGHQMFIFWPVENCTTWNLRYLMLRDAGWALRHWRSCCKVCFIKTVFVQVLNWCLVVKAPAKAIMQRKMPTWTRIILTCFYKIDCCAAIHGRIWTNNVPNESRIIMLSGTEKKIAISFLDCEKFGVKPGFPFFLTHLL